MTVCAHRAMVSAMRSAFLSVLLLLPQAAAAATVPLDISGVRPGPIGVVRAEETVAISWPDETGREWRAVFSLDPAKPLIVSIGTGTDAIVRDARPFYQGETGKRRGGWYAFFDDPTTHPEGTRHVQGTLQLRGAVARSVGERLEIVFEGARLGSFDGGLAYTFYPGSRLIQQEAVLTTNEPDVAYYYDAGLEMAAPSDRRPGNNMSTEVAFYDTDGVLRRNTSNGLQAERVPVQARYRTLALQAAGGSVAVFPAPHRYFFPRDFTSNLGYVWHRAWRGRVALGIRQLRDENWQYYPWMNAPPGRPQRMGVFFLLSSGAPDSALADVLRYTNSDRFRPLEGYKTLSTHWHLADTVQAMANGFDWTPPFKPVLKAMGVDASMIMDFHGDGHPGDLTDLRLDELHAYFAALRAQSDPDFLLIPSRGSERASRRPLDAGVSEAGVLVHGPSRSTCRSVSTHPKYGTVYSVGNAQEMFELVQREGGYMYQTHPRTKGSTGFPDKILALRLLPRSQLPRRRVEGAALGSLLAASRRSRVRPRRRTEQSGSAQALARRGGRVPVRSDARALRAHEHQLHQARSPAGVRSMGRRARAAREGEFFTTTGEVLLPDVDLRASSATEIVAAVRADWTFPLRFAEIVWGDGQSTHREVIELADTREFGSRRSNGGPRRPAGSGRASRSGTSPATARS